ncbi:MAG: creatininase family protein [Myxococcota bacterium]
MSEGDSSAASSAKATGKESAARGRELVASRMAAASLVVQSIPSEMSVLKALRHRLPRMLVATGIGTSEGHARHLAEVATRFCGQPSRFVSTGALAAAPPPGADRDWLIVFSQGLSANARFALSHAEAWRGVILVTGLGMEAGEEVPAEKASWLDALDRRGVVRVDLGAGTEYGVLLRVIGARAGYAVSWSLLRSLASMRLESAPALTFEAEALRGAQDNAETRADAIFGPDESVSSFFSSDRTLVLVSEDGALEFVDQLSLKLAEGLLRPRPRAVDVLEFAHGPLQSIAEEPASILYIRAAMPGAQASKIAAGRKGRDQEEESWLARFRSTLDPARHWLRVVDATLPWPIAAIELEAIFDVFVLRAITEVETDLVNWPGADREAALYGASPDLPDDHSGAFLNPPAAYSLAASSVAWESRTWPEAEARVAAGCRTALLGLGSIEQHGRHLPLGTDRWIAEALLQSLEEKLGDAVALPAIPVGCASEHLDFAGTLHIEPATLEALLVDLLRSLSRHGFERAFLFTAHGGNLDALAEMGPRLCESVLPLTLRIETDLRVGAMQSQVVEAEALSPLAAGPHAGEYETSLVAHLRPGSIREEHLVPGRMVEPGEAQGLFYPSLRPNAESGVLGDPSAAIGERGQRYLTAWVDLLISGYRAAFPETPASTEKNPR